MPPDNPTVEVRQNAKNGRGRSLHAATSFAAGQTILTVSPLLILPTLSHIESVCAHCLRAGDPRAALLRMRKAGVIVSLSFDASSIAPPNMFENMRFTWNMCMPWKGTHTENLPPLGFCEVIEMATINGAKSLGLGDIMGSLTPGKRADLILIRTNDLNIAPLANIETTVVQSATPANVDTVMVDGRLVKRYGHLLDYDVAGIVERAGQSALRIRKAARTMFSRNGFPATTVAEIAREAGVSPATVGHAFALVYVSHFFPPSVRTLWRNDYVPPDGGRRLNVHVLTSKTK
jgi:hypothetical protein